MSEHDNQVVIGWREAVDFPEWGIKRVHAKIDTGACNSAIHVENIEVMDEGHLKFEVVVKERPTRQVVECVGRIERHANIKPSTGEVQERPIVTTVIQVGDVEREIEVSLISREGMRCRMLLGRSALAGIYVDPINKYLLTDAPRKKKKKKRK